MNISSNDYETRINATEVVIFCDENGTPTGETAPKLDAHNNDTKMHRAFSVYVFNDKGQFLVTKRASTKKVWHDIWTNSCCGHLAPGETEVDAIKRRLEFELGISATDFQEVIQDYTYKTPSYNGIIDHEYCPVYVARSNDQLSLNPDEVMDYKWVDWDWFVNQAKEDSADYSNPIAPDAPKWSWWCKDQLKQLKESEEFNSFIAKLRD